MHDFGIIQPSLDTVNKPAANGNIEDD